MNGNYIFVILVVLGVIAFLIGVGFAVKNVHNMNIMSEIRIEYCIENGWNGSSYIVDYGYVCYKKIPHESGIGMEIIYSGVI